MTDFTFDLPELFRHQKEMHSISEDLTTTASEASEIGLGDASFGPLVSFAVPAANLLIDCYGESIEGLADNFLASAEKLGDTSRVYSQVEDANTSSSQGMV